MFVTTFSAGLMVGILLRAGVPNGHVSHPHRHHQLEENGLSTDISLVSLLDHISGMYH